MRKSYCHRTITLFTLIPKRKSTKLILNIFAHRRICSGWGDFGAGFKIHIKLLNIIKEAGIRYADNLGNGLFESLLLCRKYGISPTLEAPALGFKLPFLHGELPEFEKMYRKIVRRMKSNIAMIESILKYELIGRKNQVWILWAAAFSFAAVS